MSINETNIKDSQVISILNIEENHFKDIKSIDISPGKLTKTLSAFANADGGELFIGIDENKKEKKRFWRGFSNIEAANGHIQIFSELFPIDGNVYYSFLRNENEQGIVLKAEILKTRDIKQASDGLPYLRRGAQNLPINNNESLRRLEYDKGVSSFEQETVPCELKVVNDSLAIIDFLINVIPSAEPEDFLNKQQLVKNNKPTVGCILLFADEPQAILPKRCGIKIYRYKTSNKEGSRDVLDSVPLTIEGPIYNQIKLAVGKTKDIIESIGILGEERVEKVFYPQETLHEIITNAILHRDYSIQDDIHIRIFDNRIEVKSPGKLPGNITVENILNERSVRNGSIFRLINKYPDPPNMDVGEGLNTAFDAMIKAGLKEPIIQEINNNVLVTIKHEKLASPYILILEYLERNDEIKNKQARLLCHIDADYKVKLIFENLRKRLLIENVPGTRTSSTSYRKGPKYSNWREEFNQIF